MTGKKRRILLTGANGYIGKRLLTVLLENGCQVVCCVRDASRFKKTEFIFHENIEVVEVDWTKEPIEIEPIKEIDAAYYLIHSMSDNNPHYEVKEVQAASIFVKVINQTNAQQIIYLSGISNQKQLSKHLASRKKVGEVLRSASVPVTILRAGIVVGSGSASFEIIRDLVEKLPIMITPKWLNTKSHPIAIKNVLEFLYRVLLKEFSYDKIYDIGGPEVLTYKQMLLQFAEVRHLKRWIWTLPIMTPKLSSFWLYFVTSTTYSLASNLVKSMKVEVIARPNDLAKKLNIDLLTYKESVARAFQKIEQNDVVSSWVDAFDSKRISGNIAKYVDVPEKGCFTDKKTIKIDKNVDQVLDNIWSIGGNRGWYYGDVLWKLRGFLDRIIGGVGLRRGRKNDQKLNNGDALDFWRVVLADKESKRLLLFSEMKLPGEAWLEFKIEQNNGSSLLHQTATFRPKGLLGRLYWYSVLPFHYFIFNGMIKNIANYNKKTI